MTGSNKQIHVLAIAPYRFLPATNGGQKNIALFYKYFSQLISLTCATVKGTTKNSVEGNYDLMPIFSGNPIRYINPLYFFSLKKIIRERNITHVMLEHPYYGWLGWLLKKFVGVKLIIHSHNIEGLRFKSIGKWWWRILWQYEKMAHHMANYSFFISEEDRQYAVKNFGLNPDATTVITYGIQQHTACTQEQKTEAKKAICRQHSIDEHKLLLLYSATLHYKPNLTALDAILEEINPLLLQNNSNYTIVVCGSHLPEQYNRLEAYKDKNIVYAGFVDDIDLYFRAADIFLNPISEGGGIKTKLVEALAGNTSAVSYKSGAHGVPVSVTGKKLHIVNDNDIHAFAGEIQSTTRTIRDNIPPDFFQHFYWDNIARKAAKKMEALH